MRSIKSSHLRAFIALLMLSFVLACTTGDGDNGAEDHKTGQKENAVQVAPRCDKKEIEKCNFNIYLENSGSMDGYVKGVTKFEDCIYNLISDIKISHLCDSLNLFYINSKPIEWQRNARSTEELYDFINRLEPSTFKERGGNRKTSDLQHIIDTVLESVNEKNVSVIISDLIFSLGQGKSAVDYLAIQQSTIKTTFAEKLEKHNISALMLQCYSGFSGMYYPMEGGKIELSGVQRPYYILLMGPDGAIKNFIGNIDFDKLKSRGYAQMFYCHKHEVNPAKFRKSKVSIKDRIGYYDIDMPATDCRIKNADVRKDKDGKSRFQFSVMVDFSTILEAEGYFTDTSHYELPANYTIQVQPVIDTTETATSGYTHILKLSTNDLRDHQNVFIRLKDELPSWVNLGSSTDDRNIRNEDEQKKTFGILYVVQGISDAYKRSKDDNKYLFIADVDVKKK